MAEYQGERLIWDADWLNGQIILIRECDRYHYGIDRYRYLIRLTVIEPLPKEELKRCQYIVDNINLPEHPYFSKVLKLVEAQMPYVTKAIQSSVVESLLLKAKRAKHAIP